MNHIKFMKRALELAEMGRGRVSPNPAVGALIVKNGKIIGEGFHKGPGYPHAEIEAIESAGSSIEGSVLYCTLEPCSTMYEGKKQKPCTKRIIGEKISQVVIAMIDPNPHVNGKGVKELKNSGIDVLIGILEDEAKKLNDIFIKNQIFSLPFVHLKIAQTVDGRIATENKDSKWITDEKAREDVHILRSQYESVLIGAGTAEVDNPLLTIRLDRNLSIKRIILNSDLSLSPSLKVFTDQKNNPTYLICRQGIDPLKKVPFEKKNIKILEIPLGENKEINLRILMKELYKAGINSILIEGGSNIFSSFIREELFDKISVYIAPKICGTGIDSVLQLGIQEMNKAIELADVSYKQITNQIIMTGYRS